MTMLARSGIRVSGVILAMLLGCASVRAVEIVADTFDVAGAGSGFSLNSGVNAGINPPSTRLSGVAAPGLRYLNTATKAASAYSISGNKLAITAAASPGRFVLSADGATPYDFGPILGVAGATPASPVSYDVTISMNNGSSGVQRFSFALGSAEGDATTWNFGVQIYRTNSANSFYTIGKRINSGASGLAGNLNAPIYIAAVNTYGTEIHLLMRVTDAGPETNAFHSRVQLSLNGGATWVYDTQSDPDLMAAGAGWRLTGSGRYFMWDAAPDAGPVTYDNFSVNLNAKSNATIRVMTYNIHFGVDPTDGSVDTQRTSDFILAQGADLVCLNEVDRFRARSGNRDLIGEISQKTGMSYVYSNNIPTLSGNDEYGNAILSRFPILFRDHRLLPKLGSNEQRGWLKAVVDVNGKFVSFWATHLASVGDGTERLMCATNFNAWVDDETLPVLICGDFNETPDKSVHALMSQKWDDTWLIAGSGLGRTSPSPGPPQTRIDYIWRARGTPLQPTNAMVSYDIVASDHFPVLMDFVLTNFDRHAEGFSFPLNEGKGSKATDVIGGLSGKFSTNAPAWSTDSPTGHPWDFSLYFDGTKKLAIPDPAQILGTNGADGDYTLQAWVKLPTGLSPTNRMILFQYERRPGFSFSINTNRTLHTTAFKLKDISSSAAVPNDGLWHHVAVVHTDGVGMVFYIDASLAAMAPYTNGAGFRTSALLTLGAASDDGNWFTGYLDRVAFENRALSAAQFDFPARNATDLAAWLAWYKLNAPDGDPDGDGQNNLAEYVANTNPTNAASVFKIVSALNAPDGSLTLSWNSVGGTRYRVQTSTNAETGFIDIPRDASLEIDQGPVGQPSTQTFTASPVAGGGQSYYRVKVVP